MISGRLIALDKQIGIRLVRVGETWQRLMAKCLIWVTGKEATAACGGKQLAGGVEVHYYVLPKLCTKYIYSAPYFHVYFW